MATRLSVMLVALSMIATFFLGVVAAQPPPPPYAPANGAAWIGPRPLDNCEVPQALGYNGNPDGSAGGTGANGYHSYINDQVGILLDSCLSGTDVAAWPGCASGEAQNDVTVGLGEIQNGTLAQNVDLILQGVNTITTDASNFYQNECGGLLGTGTDGEFEYGTLAAALNVREGPGPGNKGDGTDSCIGERSSAHHADDTTVYVQDAIVGGKIGFSVSADWARPAGLSNDNTDRNSRDDRPDISHCGDGTIEPCVTATAYNGWRNDVLIEETTPETPPAPTSSDNLAHALDVIFGCNPLDTTAHVDPVAATLNSWTVPGGGTLSTWSNGGASGWLLVTVDLGSEADVCYDTAGGCPAGNGGDDVSVGQAGVYDLGRMSAPTVGWIWTGDGAPSDNSCVFAPWAHGLPYICSYVENDPSCPSGKRRYVYSSSDPNPHKPVNGAHGTHVDFIWSSKCV